MSLGTLLEGWCEDPPDILLLGLGLDSRTIRAGEAFIAVAGQHAHGLDYAPEAQRRGASVSFTTAKGH
jgi:UDP-N-acetylmuramoyl-L-alanyl-D-glutamate--2,6-diaminopimelate ligase